MNKFDHNSANKGDVWFVYDGNCPICNIAANGLAIKRAVGQLNLIDARDSKDHPVVDEINRLGFDLDEGMVIKFQDTHYHGSDALAVMAYLGTNKGWFNRFMYLFFRSQLISKLCYPFMRAIRSLAIRMVGVGKIKNLQSATEKYVIFEHVFGDRWQELPLVMHKHYANRAYSDDVTIMEGTMSIESSKYAKLLSPAFRLLGTLVPYEAIDIPVTVKALSSPDSVQYIFDREFRFKTRAAHRFHSAMEHYKNNEVIEFMRFGIGWKSAFFWEDGKVVLKHRGYVWRIFGLTLPLPVTWVIGSGSAYETPLSGDEFRMSMQIDHPLFGKIYGYHGTFKVI